MSGARADEGPPASSLPHLFEFNDLPGVPKSLRYTLRDALLCANGKPFRPHFEWVVDQVAREVEHRGVRRIVELGAGSAPVTRRLARSDRFREVELVPCDLTPDGDEYRRLMSAHDNVRPVFEPVDFSVVRDWGKGSLAVLSTAFHHVPRPQRAAVLEALSESAERVLIVEPLRRNFASLLLCSLAFLAALAAPLHQLGRQGTLRRVFWTWVFPVAPILFVWDGVISFCRQPDFVEWSRRIPNAECTVSLCAQAVCWSGSGVRPAATQAS